MKKNRIFGILAVTAATFGLVMSTGNNTVPVIQADEITDAQKNITELEKKKKEISDSLAKLEEKKDNILVYITELDTKLTSLEEEIEILNGKIETLSAQLETTKVELAAAKKKEEDQYNAMMSRIKYNYENNSDSYLSLLFESESVVDFLNNALYAKEMAEFDQNMYDDYKSAKELVQTKEQELEEQLATYEDLKATQEYEKKSVKKLYNQKKAELKEYNDSISKTQEEIDAYNTEISQSRDELEKLILEAQRKAQEEERRRKEEEERRRREEQAAQNANGSSGNKTDNNSDSTKSDGGSTGNYSGVGYAWPLPSSHRITSGFGPRKSPTAGASSYHKGIDIGASSGSTIVAAKGGTVIISQYSSSAGNYVMISHGDGMFTSYMHCSSLLVSVGDKVNQGDAIARVGSTGISTGPHLHFAVTRNGEYLNPLSFVS